MATKPEYKCPTCNYPLKEVSCCSKAPKWLYCAQCKKKFPVEDFKKE